MAFYPKKLNSLEELEREKQLLLSERKELESGQLFSIEGLWGKGDKEEEAGGLENLLDLLPGGSPVISTVAGIVKDLLARGRKKGYADGNEEKKDSILSKAAREFVGGYLKWKAVELSFKGIRYLIKSRRKK